MNDDQSLRAAALQAAAVHVAALSGDMKDLLYTADLLTHYITNGSHPSAQLIAEEGRTARHRAAVEAIQQRATDAGLMDTQVYVEGNVGQLGSWLQYCWDRLPEQPVETGAGGVPAQRQESYRTDLGL